MVEIRGVEPLTFSMPLRVPLSGTPSYFLGNARIFVSAKAAKTRFRHFLGLYPLDKAEIMW